jgi:hypothetical protein
MSATASRTVSFHAFANTPNDAAVPSAIHASRIRRSDKPTPVIDPYRSHTNDRTPPNRQACPTNSPYLPTLRSREYAIRVTFTPVHLPSHASQGNTTQI